jgi:hypothetical protein
MPKKPNPDKKTRARNRPAGGAFRQPPASVNDLLQRRPALTGLASRIPAQRAWCDWLRLQLPPELAAHVVNVVPKAIDAAARSTELIVLADSPAWSARLRYALVALQPAIAAKDIAVQRTRVRVSMSGLDR